MRNSTIIEHAIAYKTRGHTWVFRFSEGNDVLVVMLFAGMAINPEVDFNWSDAINCKQLVMNEVGE